MWNRRIRVSKLGQKLLIQIAASIVITLGLWWALTFLETFALTKLYSSEEMLERQSEETAQEFQEYVSEYQITLSDVEEIREWDRENSLLSIKLIVNNRVIYDTQNYALKYAPKAVTGRVDSQTGIGYPIVFPDGTAVLYVGMVYKNKLEKQADFIIAAGCILGFCWMILRGVAEIVRDIMILEDGIRILESGDLSWKIEMKRRDELGELADSLNRMSTELLKRGEEEERLRQEKYDLVTAVSHDIRTPLTSVISYTDLCLDSRKAPEEKEKYLEKIKDRAYLIKDLTDNLFLYFVNKSHNYELHPELVTGNEFVQFLLNNMKEELTDRGYQFRLDAELIEEFFLKVDVVQIRRVFNNLEGNLIKYAKKGETIQYRAFLSENSLCIVGRNGVQTQHSQESHGVGIVSSMEIIKLHSGEMESHIEDGMYVVRIRLPILLLSQLSEGGSTNEETNECPKESV